MIRYSTKFLDNRFLYVKSTVGPNYYRRLLKRGKKYSLDHLYYKTNHIIKQYGHMYQDEAIIEMYRSSIALKLNIIQEKHCR